MSDSKRERILKTADLLFKRHGLKKTTIEEIAKDAGIGKGTVYNYFTSKEEIFFAVQRALCQEVLQRLRSVVRKELNPRQQLIKFMQARTAIGLEMIKDYPMNGPFISESQTESEYRVVRDEYFHDEALLVRSILEDGAEKGLLLIKNFDRTVWAVTTLLKGLTLQIFLNDKDVTPSAVEFLANTLIDGISKR